MAEYDDNFEMDDDDDVPNEHDALRREVGDCIHSWCELERALVSVLSWVLNTPDHKADIIFAGVVSFAAKLDFIDELMQEELEDRPELGFWVSMAGNLRTLSKARNVLAHHAPITRLVSRPDDPVKMKTVISPSRADPRRRAKKRRGYTLADTRMLAMEIKHHAGLLDELVYHLDETQLRPNVFHKAHKPLDLFNELKNAPAWSGKKKKKTWEREKAKPPVWFTGKPEELAGWLQEQMKEE
ncbi:hypothetical protein [Hyphomicrobium zavarzinii]|jgi:hypothetical protein|uniref:hypothetical protein n=1 Tax=Hyphomicrobium zavarzinii TaxID=48292 RepID=UPI000380CE74|nr:hypothetical protein [Hyphomicrobium zavarzinii]